MLMSQPNGLPDNVLQFDTITSHDWANTAKWPAPDNSIWDLTPSDGKALKLTGVLIRFSENMIVHNGGDMIVELLLDGFPYSPYEVTRYSCMRDFMARADFWDKLDYNGPTGGDVNSPIIGIKLDFSKPVILWSSASFTSGGPEVDLLGNIKFKTMRTRIADNQPYKNDSGDPVQIACSRYFVEVYQDPDFEE